jgi:TatD DNase family protein
MFIDSHTHLTSKEFDEDRDDVVRRAEDAGVSMMINPAVDVSDSRRAIDLADRHAGVFACVGVHPHEAAKATERDFEEIEELSRSRKVVAIGEIGLDFYYDFSPVEVQKETFRRQLRIARDRNLPVVIHTRDSIQETIDIVEEMIAADPGWRSLPSGQRRPRGVFHCFSGDLGTAHKVIGMGFYVSFPGMVTFRNAATPRAVAAAVPLDDLLLETDSPYLAPVPLRGKRNEPKNIPLIAACIAELRHCEVADVGCQTTYNCHDLFGIGDPEPGEAA